MQGMKPCGGGIGVQFHSFLSKGLVGQWSALSTGCFILVERANSTHLKGGSVKHTAVLDVLKEE